MNDYSKYKFYIKNNSDSRVHLIDGIENLEIKKVIASENSSLLGQSDSIKYINSPIESLLSLQRSILNRDELLNYTGNSGMNAYLYDGNANYEIKGISYLSKYSINFTIGDIPKANYEIVNFGNINANYNTYNSDNFNKNYDGKKYLPYNINSELAINSNSHELPTIKLGDLMLSGFPYNDYSVYSIQYTATMSRLPLYSIGSVEPTIVHSILPINVEVSLNAKIKNEKQGSYFEKNHYESQEEIGFSIYNCNATNNFYHIRCARLTETYMKVSNSSTSDIILNFKGIS